jgi:hypothetical protein
VPVRVSPAAVDADYANLAAREFEANKDFPEARAELLLNTHGSFFAHSWRSNSSLLANAHAAAREEPAADDDEDAAPSVASFAASASAAADDDTASLLLSEWRRRAAMQNAERVAAASERADERQLELRRQSLLRQDEALRRAQQQLAKSINEAVNRERSDRERVDAERDAELAAAEALRQHAERIAAAAQAKRDRLRAEAEAKARAEAEARARAEAEAAKARAEAQAAKARADAEAAKAQADADAKAAAAAAAAAATAAADAKTGAAVSTATTSSGDTLKMPSGRSCLATPEALALYTRCVKHVESMAALAAKAEAEPTWTETKKLYDKHVNQKINAITPDREHAKRLVVSLLGLITETVKQPDKRAHTVYCLMLIARKIVARAAQLKGTTAEVFPVADVASLLMSQVAGLRDLVLGYLFLDCPYAAPVFPLRDTRESDDEYREHGLAYRRGLGGELESEADYKLRQVDFIVLFAALVRAGDAERHASEAELASAKAWSDASAKPKSVGIAWAWVWLSRMLNTKPRRVSLVLLEAFLQICGHDLARTYPRQFPKLIQYFATQYAALLERNVDVDAKSRLHSLLVEEKCARPPQGAHY